MRTPKQIVIQREMDYRVRQMKKSMARYQDWKSKQVGVFAKYKPGDVLYSRATGAQLGKVVDALFGTLSDNNSHVYYRYKADDVECLYLTMRGDDVCTADELKT